MSIIPSLIYNIARQPEMVLASVREHKRGVQDCSYISWEEFQSLNSELNLHRKENKSIRKKRKKKRIVNRDNLYKCKAGTQATTMNRGQDLYKGLMANSKYEYVKSSEVVNKIAVPNIIIVRIDGCNFHRFSEVYKFEKPNDEKALNLMNSCASAILEEFPEIMFSYGFGDEYRIVRFLPITQLRFEGIS
ncbi:tRNAHis guanylyltransferase catalytic domain [Dillenia turbinata]|uniref:tRNAHis guanylyltransferase catalytic domain n=1 Tax=Dillenia turbinata TaxID=194707 RepID=A0AAN8Z4J3_9MAGN